MTSQAIQVLMEWCCGQPKPVQALFAEYLEGELNDWRIRGVIINGRIMQGMIEDWESKQKRAAQAR